MRPKVASITRKTTTNIKPVTTPNLLLCGTNLPVQYPLNLQRDHKHFVAWFRRYSRSFVAPWLIHAFRIQDSSALFVHGRSIVGPVIPIRAIVPPQLCIVLP